MPGEVPDDPGLLRVPIPEVVVSDSAGSEADPVVFASSSVAMRVRGAGAALVVSRRGVPHPIDIRVVRLGRSPGIPSTVLEPSPDVLRTRRVVGDDDRRHPRSLRSVDLHCDFAIIGNSPAALCAVIVLFELAT